MEILRVGAAGGDLMIHAPRKINPIGAIQITKSLVLDRS